MKQIGSPYRYDDNGVVKKDRTNLIFSHNTVGNLTVQTGADEITWGYGLNTETIPTYGGEVVQILSAFVDNVTITGTLPTYSKLEEIHKWFLAFMNSATQVGRFNTEPVVMKYPHRGWRMRIIPLEMPAFRYGREVVAPTWQLTAHVFDEDRDVDAQALIEAAQGISFNGFDRGIGWDEDNPFTDPAAASSTYDPKEGLKNTADFYTSLVEAYLDHDFDHILDGWPNPSQTGPVTGGADRSGAAKEEAGKKGSQDNENRGEETNAESKPKDDPFALSEDVQPIFDGVPGTTLNFSEDQVPIGSL